MDDARDDAQSESVGREAPPTMPSRGAFLLTFVSVVGAGVFGGVIGYGLVDIDSPTNSEGSKLLGIVFGALIGAVGVGIVAVLMLRAMSEWKRSPRNRPMG
jgi:lipid-binding SYLF domain-containing protein